MYDRKPEKGKVMGQSLGYGFVQFQYPDHALTTLRYLNNNPDIFGPNKVRIHASSLYPSVSGWTAAMALCSAKVVSQMLVSCCMFV